MVDLDVKIVVALIAVFVSFAGLIIAKEQKISEFRQKWIDEIRNDIANLMGCLTHFCTSWIVLENNTDTDVRRAFLKDNILTINEIYVLLNRIKLRLNLVKDKELIDTLNEIDAMITSPDNMNDDSLFENLTSKLNLQSHTMLKTEWTRVKEGEFIYKVAKFTFGFFIVICIFILIKVLACLYI